MMKTMSKINIANLGRPELPTGSAIVSKSPSADGTMDNTSGAGVSTLPNDDRMFLEEEECNCLEIVESLQTLKAFQMTSQKRWKLKTSMKIPELDGQRRPTK